jgi:hypothetical protein
MNDIVHVTAVEPLEGLSIRATFSDGAVKAIYLGELFAGEVFEPIRRSREAFVSVRINRETGTVEWPGGVDLDPEVLYGRFEPASGARITRRTLREPLSSGTRGAAA